MGGGNNIYRYFFSSCSDRLISQFVSSESASCLRRIDETKNPVIDPSFSNPKAPTMLDVCKRVINSDKAYIDEVLIFGNYEAIIKLFIEHMQCLTLS